jgi:hypothetical protein
LDSYRGIDSSFVDCTLTLYADYSGGKIGGFVKKLIAVYIVLVVCFAFGVGFLTYTVLHEIRDNGIKTIVDSAWCGSKGCEKEAK